MSTRPPEWNEDKRLWDLLGKLPSEKAPTDFVYRLTQKMAQKPIVNRSLSQRLLASWRRWVPVTALAAASLSLSAIAYFRMTPNPQVNSVDLVLALEQRSEDRLAQVAQNYELIQDLDVLENLDQL